ncbi:hypothetical protein [Mycolicibacterium sp. P9-22]|uniref:hypothetical protein n=1 Tax=Mycolicibacterium sp. P9-22 TaxID=2024613 RepID=UPI0011EC80D1|nr:hypothetical protein [Mycolicibacterium sp. P9-22]KAA0114403.1 hypothetical protein CIW51_18940 [Mycolicibacterium sp. P9-22]
MIGTVLQRHVDPRLRISDASTGAASSSSGQWWMWRFRRAAGLSRHVGVSGVLPNEIWLDSHQ